MTSAFTKSCQLTHPSTHTHSPFAPAHDFTHCARSPPTAPQRPNMSFDALQERLTALQETTSQVKELIDRLAKLDFQPGSVPQQTHSGYADDDDENVATELSAEINQTLREEEEELELLEEEATDLRGGKEGSELARRKERLLEGVKRVDGEVKR